MANSLLENLSAAAALSGSDLFYVKQGGARGLKATGTQLLALVGTTYVPLAGGAMTGPLTIASGTLTASAPALSVTQTWNNAGVAFHAFDVSITSTGSTLASTLQRWIVGGTEMVSIQKDGIGSFRGGISAGQHPAQATTANYYNFGVRVTSAGSYEWTSGSATASADLYLYRDAAATLAQRNGTTQQIFRLYNTYTDSSNYERLTLTGVAGTSVNITAETLGTGADNINIVLTPAGTGVVSVPALVSATSFTCGNDVTMNFSSAGIRTRSTGEYAWTAGNATAAADTAIHRDSAGVAAVDNGTAGTYRDLKLRNLLAGGGNGSYVQTPSMKVTNLAAAETAGAGARAFVTDATATTFLSTVAGGGSNKVPVVSDGTNWLIG